IATEEKELPELLTQITRIMADAGLDVITLRPRQDISRNGYSEIPIEITAEGSYENIIKSFAALRKIDCFMMFQNIKMRFDENDTYVKMSMQIILYGVSSE
ncbi:MAG: type 4a pilus biogenesis protein PilO, partial [Deltaproteobacteria bacterium]|nr:type 4a pilus biogenesis protein PilO [Deltaproteobacteria bacterium]